MRTNFKFFKSSLAIFTVSGLLTLQLPTSAQAADATAVLQGNFYNSTCILNITDNGVVTAHTSGASKTIDMGTVNIADISPTLTTGQLFGSVKVIDFAIKDASGAPCSLGTANTTWGLHVSVPASDYFAVGGYRFLANKSIGGSNAVLRLLTAATGQQWYLTEQGSVTARFNKNDSLVVHLQFATSTNGVPTPGAFTASLPITVSYQ